MNVEVDGLTEDSLPIECNGLVVERGDFVLGPIDLTISTGATILLGRNGAGKTTLLRSFMGLEALSGGEILVDGISTRDRRLRRESMLRVGFAPQLAALPKSARVADTVAYAAWLKGVKRQESADRVRVALETLNIEQFAGRRVGGLSGGERQRVSIAMAIVHEPQVLLLDEPSAGLDPIQRVSLRNVIDEIATDRAVLLSTHLVEEVAGGREHVVVLDNGSIVFTGSAAELEDRANSSAPGNSALERGIWTTLGGEGRS